MPNRQELEREIDRLNALVAEAEARLGAHSVKPVLMHRLFELEEARDDLKRQLEALCEKETRQQS